MESKHKKITKLSILIIIPILLINLFNQMIIKLANRKSVLPTKDGMYYDWRFGKLFYTCEGEGSPILLIHELSSYGSSIEFHELIHQLSKSIRYMLWIFLDVAVLKSQQLHILLICMCR